MNIDSAKTQTAAAIKSTKEFVESLKQNENPKEPRFGTTIQYLEKYTIPALEGIEKALD